MVESSVAGKNKSQDSTSVNPSTDVQSFVKYHFRSIGFLSWTRHNGNGPLFVAMDLHMVEVHLTDRQIHCIL